MSGIGVEFRFIAGRYHSTPWYNYVNEGFIEWPPSPYRLVRALAAVGMRKLGWSNSNIPQEFVALVDKLAKQLPVYKLPEVVFAHTRHPMPVPGKDKQLLMDNFALVDKEDKLIVWWPDIELDSAERVLLDRLVSGMGYLGRAESWVEGKVIDSVNVDRWDAVPENGSYSNGDIVRLLALKTPEQFDNYLKDNPVIFDLFGNLAEAVINEETNFVVTIGKGRKAKKLKAPIPHAARWSYYILGNLLGDGKMYIQKGLNRELDLNYHMALYEIVPFSRHGGGRVPVGYGLRVAEAVHRRILGAASRIFGKDNIPTLFSGRSKEKGIKTEHSHVFILPVDVDFDGYIDHVVLWSEDGFDNGVPIEDVLRTLGSSVGKVDVEGMGVGQFLTFMGGYESLSDDKSFSPWFGQSSTWVSWTPYFFSRHPKNKTLKKWREAIIYEIEELRGYGKVKRVSFLFPGKIGPRLTFEDDFGALIVRPEVRGYNDLKFASFQFIHKSRFKSVRPAINRALSVFIEFEKPVYGPVVLGHAAHFGLGLFVKASVD